MKSVMLSIISADVSSKISSSLVSLVLFDENFYVFILLSKYF